jgi:hypothetical protein
MMGSGVHGTDLQEDPFGGILRVADLFGHDVGSLLGSRDYPISAASGNCGYLPVGAGGSPQFKACGELRSGRSEGHPPSDESLFPYREFNLAAA